MLPIRFDIPRGRRLKVLCLGAHSDDIEIGCGGSVRRLARDYELDVTWVVLGASGERRQEAESSAADFVQGAAATRIEIEGFRNSFFPYNGEAVKEYVESIKSFCSPDVVFSHYRHDLHQDHRVISELTWNAFRNHVILEYEIPKYDGGLGSPNAFFPLSREDCDEKIHLIMKHFASQRPRAWFTADTFWALLRLRGIECNSESGFAEAHYLRKAVF